MPLTGSMPKCCLLLDGRTLLEHQLDALAANGIDDIVVVTGFGHRYVENLVNRVQGMSVRTLYNPFYALSDNLGTSWVARNEMKTPFLLINGNTLFEPSALTRLLCAERPYPITLATDRKEHYEDDDMKVSTDGDRLKRVGNKLPADIVNGESVGMMVFDQAGAVTFVQKVESLMAGSDGLVRWYLSAVDELAMTGIVGSRSIRGYGWCEINDLNDLTDAEASVQGWPSTTESATHAVHPVQPDTL